MQTQTTSSPSSTLLPDLWQQILSWLDLPTLGICNRVCKQWYHWVHHNATCRRHARYLTSACPEIGAYLVQYESEHPQNFAQSERMLVLSKRKRKKTLKRRKVRYLEPLGLWTAFKNLCRNPVTVRLLLLYTSLPYSGRYIIQDTDYDKLHKCFIVLLFPEAARLLNGGEKYVYTTGIALPHHHSISMECDQMYRFRIQWRFVKETYEIILQTKLSTLLFGTDPPPTKMENANISPDMKRIIKSNLCL